MTKLDLLHQRFGRLLVTGQAVNGSNGRTRWTCNCDCGVKDVVVGTKELRNGDTESCGCVYRESHRKHGHVSNGRMSREYSAWVGMKDRCYSSSREGFPLYGGRGIRVHPAWVEDFRNFLRDMGPCPKGFSIDRVDNDGDYEPGNCRWASAAEQARNRRTTRFIEYQGKPMIISEVAGIHRLSVSSLWYWHYKRGFPIEAAIQFASSGRVKGTV